MTRLNTAKTSRRVLAVDVVLLDISMPDLSGESVCQQLRTNPAFDGLKIVA